MYIDEYASCKETYATLCIYPGDIDPEEVTLRLGVYPSEWQRTEEVPHHGRTKRPAKINAWFLKSKEQVESRDSRRHIDWLLERLMPNKAAVLALQEAGAKMVVSCFWLSSQGHGGPIVSPAQMGRLAELRIELSFDFYGPYGDENA